jgi:hypothetical protein
MPTDYHWLLVYECLKEQITPCNDGPVPSVVKRLRTLASDQDTPYVYLPKRSRGTAGVWIDFDKVIDVYFWDTDFLPPTPSNNSGSGGRYLGRLMDLPRTRTSLS